MSSSKESLWSSIWGRSLKAFAVFLFYFLVAFFLLFNTNPIPSDPKSEIVNNSSDLYHENTQILPQERPRTPKERLIIKQNLKKWLREKIDCSNKTHERRVYQKLNFWVVENFVRGFHGNLDCSETVTLTITAEYPDLRHLGAILRRWKAPISVALYCSREDYGNCLETLAFLRRCNPVDSQTYFLLKYVSFHIFFEDDKIPENVYQGLSNTFVTCYENPMDRQIHPSTTRDLYRKNVGKNIAKEGALTHYILASDIEMIPNVNLLQSFLETIALGGSIGPENGAVYLIPAFEIRRSVAIPETKDDLEVLLNANRAKEISSHCHNCKNLLDIKKWRSNNNDISLISLPSNKTEKLLWSPYYISSSENPYFDEQFFEKSRESSNPVRAFRVCTDKLQFAVMDQGFVARKKLIRPKDNQSPKSISVPEWRDGVGKLKEFLRAINYKCRLFYN